MKLRNPARGGQTHWPELTELMPAHFGGLQPARDGFLADADRERLLERVRKQGAKGEGSAAQLTRFCYRPFDVRWLCPDPARKAPSAAAAEYFGHVRPRNPWLAVAPQGASGRPARPYCTALAADARIVGPGSGMFPLFLYAAADSGGPAAQSPRANLTAHAEFYLGSFHYGYPFVAPEYLFHHILAMLYAPSVKARRDDAWPRVPLPAARDALLVSAGLGRRVAALLDTERPADLPEEATDDVPAEVREYRIGGQRVMKGREAGGLEKREAGEVRAVVRRVAALLLTGPALERNYEAVAAGAYPWPPGALLR